MKTIREKALEKENETLLRELSNLQAKYERMLLYKRLEGDRFLSTYAKDRSPFGQLLLTFYCNGV